MNAAGATVARCWRYPVKSMLGEEIETSIVGERGLAGDRGYAVVDAERGRVASAKHPRRWGILLQCRAEYLEPPGAQGALPPVLVTLPDGATVRSDDADVNDRLSRALGHAVQLVTDAPPAVIIEEYLPDVEGVDPARRDTVGETQIGLLSPPGAFFDAAPVHVVTTATIAALERAYPSGRFDPRRFRPNMLIDTGSSGPERGFVENAWVGRSARLGAGAVVDVVMSVPRCVMTTLPQGDLAADKGILQTIARENRFDIRGLGSCSCAGVYGVVSTAGAVSVGDPVVIAGD